MTTGRVFISYSKADAAAATQIRDLLADNEFTCWMAPDSITGASPWAVQIVDAIRNAPLLLIVLSEAANGSSHVSREVDLAVDDGIPILPVRIEDVVPAGSLAYLLRLHQWIDVLGPIEAHTRTIVQAVAAVVAGREPTQPAPADAAAPRSSPLPLPPDSFIGRESEIERLGQWIGEQRMVAVAGAGGVGKTRLALEVGSQATARFADGVWFVDLADVDDPALIPPLVAAATGLGSAGDLSAGRVASRLSTRSGLLILDGCDRVVDGTARLAEEIIRRGERMHILATCREPLRVAGEAVFRVEPMPVPAADSADVAQAAAVDAVQLFVDRARQLQTDLLLDESSVGPISTICNRLDGIPLAIELAAARCGAFTPAEIAGMLSERLALLGGGRRTSVAHHRTLDAALAWSYDALSPTEQRVFERTSLFCGSFSLGAARTVCDLGDLDAPVPPTIADLVDKSLLSAALAEANRMRYRMLGTVREYARQKLDAGGDHEAIRATYVRYWVGVVHDVERRLLAQHSDAALARLSTDHVDVRQALALAADAADKAGALQLAAGMALLWVHSGVWMEGTSWLERRWSKLEAEAATGSLEAGLLSLSRISTPAEALLELARMQLAGNDAERAVHLMGAAAAVERIAGSETGAVTPQDLAQAEEALGEDEFRRIFDATGALIEQIAGSQRT